MMRRGRRIVSADSTSLGNQMTSAGLHLVAGPVVHGAGRDVRG